MAQRHLLPEADIALVVDVGLLGVLQQDDEQRDIGIGRHELLDLRVALPLCRVGCAVGGNTMAKSCGPALRQLRSCGRPAQCGQELGLPRGLRVADGRRERIAAVASDCRLTSTGGSSPRLTTPTW